MNADAEGRNTFVWGGYSGAECSPVPNEEASRGVDSSSPLRWLAAPVWPRGALGPGCVCVCLQILDLFVPNLLDIVPNAHHKVGGIQWLLATRCKLGLT